MKVHTTNYRDTFIEIPQNSPITTAGIPPERKQKTIARKQYELLINQPYQLTSDEVLYTTTAAHKRISKEEFFSKGQPCFRASPLVKQYGWGVHFNHEEKMAIYPMESEEYQRFKQDSSLKHIQSMRQKR